MRITDDLDRPIVKYNPILDNEVDIDAPYIDFSVATNSAEIDPPENGAYDTLYYKDTPILIVNQVSEIEIRFYTTPNPNEHYRIGQRHIKGKVLSIDKIDEDPESNDGFALSFDASTEYYGKISNVTIDKNYVDITKTRCVCILYFNEQGKVTNELVIPIDEWFSMNVYLNSAFVVNNPEPYPFKVDDIVDAVIYIKQELDEDKFEVIEKEITGRLTDISLIQRQYTETDEMGVDKDYTIYYYMLTIDMSKPYEMYEMTISSTVVKSMKIHQTQPEEP